MLIVYFSKSGNTKKFVDRLGVPSLRIPEEGLLSSEEPFILITPTYSAQVPPQVVQFLNNKSNRDNLLGVVNSGNINFGPDFGAAGRTISEKCSVPLLHVFELTGLNEDVATVQKHLKELWKPRQLQETQELTS